VDMCAGGARINISLPVRMGDTLVLYVDDLGRVEGHVTRLIADGCALSLSVPPRKRDKLADQLTWLANRERLGLSDDRVGERRVASGQLMITYGKGIQIQCEVVDLSVFGVALRTDGIRPMLGDKVRVGERVGVCIRYFEGGFAVDFRAASNPGGPD
jgi:hypothetical protein